LEAYQHERELKREPRSILWRNQQLRLIPNGFSGFRVMLQGDHRRKVHILLEYDCDTEFGAHFCDKVLQELQGEPSTSALLFILTRQQLMPDPEHLRLHRCWHPLQNSQPVVLSVGE
jgi:hypothetical protein